MSTPPSPANPNKGYLFPNDAKTTDNQPDYRGKLTVEGKEFLISGWKKDKDGREMITISATDPATMPKNNRTGQTSQTGSGQSGAGQGGAGQSGGQYANQGRAPSPRPPAPSPQAPAPSAAPGAMDQGFGDIFDNLP